MNKIIFLIAFCSPFFCNAQLLVQQDLSTFTTGIQLSGQGIWTNNSSLPGGAGVATAGGANAKIVVLPMNYLDYGSSVNSMEIKPNSDACGFPFTPVTTGDLYVGFVINLSATQVNNNSDFFRILSGSNFNTSARFYATPLSAFDFTIGVAKGANGNPIATAPVSLAYEQDHLIVVKYSQLSGVNDDTVSVYIDPVFVLGMPATPTMIATSGADQSGSIDRLYVRQNWTNGMPTGRLGLVSVSKTWAGLPFMELSATTFEKITFKISANQANSGILSIHSIFNLENVKLSIYDVSGKIVETKNITLSENNNSIAINPINNTGIYIVEMVVSDIKYNQKISIN